MNDLEQSVNAKLEGDTEFQDSIKDVTDEEKTSSIESKRKELMDAEIVSLREKAEKASKHEEVAKNESIRAKKAEEELKRLKPEGKNDNNLSQKDIITIAKSNIHEDDVEDVLDYAKFKGISVAEALKSNVIKATLADKTEFRKTAAAMNTKPTRTNSQLSPQAVMDKARKGEDGIPEPGSDEAMALFRARHPNYKD